MEKQPRKNNIKKIVIIAVVIIGIIIAGVFIIRHIQRIVWLDIASSDTQRLVAALNEYNANSIAPITAIADIPINSTGTGVVLIYGRMEFYDISVHYDTPERLTEIIGFLETTGNGYWSVNIDAMRRAY